MSDRVRVRPYTRRKADEPEYTEAKVVVVSPGAGERKPTLREKLKHDLAFPPKRKKKPARKKTVMEEFADDADSLASAIEKMEAD